MATKVIVFISTLVAFVNAGGLYAGEPIAYASHAVHGPAPVLSYAAPPTKIAYSAAPSVSHVYNSYGLAPAYAYSSPTYGSSHESTVRSFGGTVAHHSKALDTAFSSVRKADTRISNNVYTPAIAHSTYAAPAYAHATYAAPIAHTYAAPAVAHTTYAKTYAAPIAHTYAAPAVAHTYAAPAVAHATYAKTYAAPIAHTYAAPAVAHTTYAKAYAAPIAHTYAAPAIAHSYAAPVAHVSYSGTYGNYAW